MSYFLPLPLKQPSLSYTPSMPPTAHSRHSSVALNLYGSNYTLSWMKYGKNGTSFNAHRANVVNCSITTEKEDQRKEHCFKPIGDMKLLDAPLSKGKPISIPMVLKVDKKKETVAGMAYNWTGEQLLVYNFIDATQYVCDLVGICEKGQYPTVPPTTPTTPTTTEPPPPPTTPTTRPPPTTYYVPAIQEDEEMSSFEIPYDRKVVKGGSAKIQILWILLIGFVWY
ncbi:hypothetical protein CRE_05865 [Caenorhabditis remanei]|uniref:Uncharacterized protein n=1 Tax=Caenorhabditis remanei TaxID=31234 RepID=E3MNH2_CAERE|nr:hypothetical protein CRE_05865 [Caenorhabditis remanei]